jgi:hypothetical protein
MKNINCEYISNTEDIILKIHSGLLIKERYFFVDLFKVNDLWERKIGWFYNGVLCPQVSLKKKTIRKYSKIANSLNLHF